MFEIFKLNKKKAAIEENIALLESKQKAMQEKIKALDELTTTRQNKADCAEIAAKKERYLEKLTKLMYNILNIIIEALRQYREGV